ncbi:MAG: APC family permease, partial [Hyphomicrobiaceae bacterium]
MQSRASKEPKELLPVHGSSPPLKRSLTLVHAVLYGLGVTIGAGIYVLIGAAAARAGMHAPLAFVLAALTMGSTAASFAELGSRMPVAAGEAAYVRAALNSDRLAVAVGILVVAIAVVSAAAITAGSAGYIAVFLKLPDRIIIAGVALAMGAIAAWGIKESVVFAGLMTIIEVGGLLVLIGAGILYEPALITRLPETIPPLGSVGALTGILSATLLAVFAFVGFEGLVNIAEELEDPQRTLPRAIFLTLALTTLFYVLVVWVALVAVPPRELAASQAPLALVFQRLTGLSPAVMSLIAIVATLNGIIVQIVLAARVLYGLGRQGNLPKTLARVNPLTRTPLVATALTTGCVLLFALLLPLERLADLTSRLTLVVFALVNAALIVIKRREIETPGGFYVAPRWMPWAGLASCLVFLTIDHVAMLGWGG